MAKQIELFDTFPIRVNVSKKNRKVIISDAKKEVKGGYSLICEVDATHSGTLINNRIYPPDKMQRGVRTWTAPYKKPVLINHDDTKDPVGRVIAAKYIRTPKGTDTDDYKPVLRESEGYGYQRLTVKITEPEAIQKVLDGRYETVSVRMATDHCWCSICEQDWSGEDGPCDHVPGQKYDGKLAFMTTGELNYREVSFVNIPADEYAGVKEAMITEKRDASEVSVYANNDSDKVLSDLGSGENLYTLLDTETEDSDSLVSYLLDKSSKSKKMDKEEDVKLTELTKEQLKDLDVVKSMIKEAVDAAIEAAAKELADKSAKDCEQKMKDALEAATKEAEDAKKKKEEKEVEEDEDAKKKKKGDGSEDEDEDAKKKKEEEKEEDEDEKKKKEMKKEEEEEEKEEEEEEEDKKKKGKTAKGTPVPNILPENKGKGKSGGSKHGAGNQGPVGEDPGDASEDTDMKDQLKNMLDENVKINSELHRMVAERLYDLKKVLRKPDVVGITTPDARDKKVGEFAQRSIDSLKDQINDLIKEQEIALTTGMDGKGLDSPAIAQSDLTNEVLSDKLKKTEGKRETLTRLFPKAR